MTYDLSMGDDTQSAILRAARDAYHDGRLNTAELHPLFTAVRAWLGLTIPPELFGGAGALSAAVDAAIRAERDRCARIVEQTTTEGGYGQPKPLANAAARIRDAETEVWG